MGKHKQYRYLGYFFIFSLESAYPFSIYDDATVTSERLQNWFRDRFHDQFRTVDTTCFQKRLQIDSVFRLQIGAPFTLLDAFLRHFGTPFTTAERRF